MGAVNLAYNYTVRVDLTVRRMSPAGTLETATYTFVNKPLRDDAAVAHSYRPLLTAVGDVSITAGEFLPSRTFSSFAIDNRPGTFGHHRKFSDVLERWTPIEGAVDVYVTTTTTAADAAGTWSQVFRGVCTGWSASMSADGGHELTFAVSPLRQKEKFVVLEVDRAVSGMASAPDSSLGRVVPLVIGTFQEVVPVRITADGAAEPRYAVATAFYQHLTNNVSTAGVLTKDLSDRWVDISATANFDNTTLSVAGAYSLNAYHAQAHKLNVDSQRVITGVQLRAKGNGSGGRVSTARLTVFIMRVDALSGAVLDDRFAVGLVELTRYDAQNNAGTANFAINVSFDRPVFLELGEFNYYLGWSVTGAAANELTINYGTATNNKMYVKSGTDAGTNGNDSYAEYKLIDPAPANSQPMYKLHETTFAFTAHVSAFTPNGLTYSRLDVTQFTPDSGQANPAFDNFPLLVTMGGLEHFSGGPDISATQNLVHRLSYEWDPATSAWVSPGEWNISARATLYTALYTGTNSNTLSRTPRAVFDSRVTFTDVLVELCRATASRVGMNRTGDLYMFPWGTPIANAASIPAADIIPMEWRQEAVDTVVNRASLQGYRGYLFSSREFENARASGQDSFGWKYSENINGVDGLYPPVVEMTRESRLLYGDRPAAAGGFTVAPVHAALLGSNGALSNGTSSALMSIPAAYLLARFAKPLVYATFRVPWAKYRTLELFDVVEFTHPDFPAYYGTNPNGPDAVVTSGTVGTSASAQGHELVVARPYRGLVESVTYQLPFDQAPMIRLTVLVLLNGQFDPT